MPRKLCVMTCARKVTGRVNRAHIDKWDFSTVSDISFFIAHKYEHADIETLQPQEKVQIKELQRDKEIDETTLQNLINTWNRVLKEKRNCIIIGSPESSDYAEVLLAKIHDIKPYNLEREKKPPFLFYKGLSKDEHPRRLSSFYRCVEYETDPGKIHWYGKDYGCSLISQGEMYKGTTYGVLTIADNPFCNDNISKVMVLSGYSGISTYGIILCLVNDEDKYKSEFYRLIKNYNEFNGSDANFLIKIDFTENADVKTGGDSRILESIEYMESNAIV